MELKKLMEQRADLQTEMEALLHTAKTEERAMTEEESAKFDDLEKQIKAIDGTIKREERARMMDKKEPMKNDVEERAAVDEKVFADYIRGVVEQRADVNMTAGDNGAVIPTSIANKIIKKVVDMSPIVQKATRYNIGGNLSIPYYDEDTQSITVSYADEFSAGVSTSGKTATIDLKGYLARALTKVSLSLVNNSNFNIVSFVINDMAEKLVLFMEKECIKGTTDKVAGLAAGVTLKVDAASATAVTADEIIQLKDKVKDAFQAGGIFIMSSATRTAIRLLKDANNRYLFQDDINAPFGATLLGKPVYVSDNMDNMAAGKTVIYYGDMSGLALKISEDINIQVLREKYADEHAIGVLGFVEFDAKVENAQKIAMLVMKAS
ncbi:MAG: phage major capsid protein [Clostridia bacterium]|nr:phage major capsid protein [Clostridia bacterium]